MEQSKKQPYAMREHYTLWGWLMALVGDEPADKDPSYYTIEQFDECKGGAAFNSWHQDNYAEAIECRNTLSRIEKKCYTVRLIKKNWLGFGYYEIVPLTLPAEIDSEDFPFGLDQHQFVSEMYSKHWPPTPAFPLEPVLNCYFQLKRVAIDQELWR